MRHGSVWLGWVGYGRVWFGPVGRGTARKFTGEVLEVQADEDRIKKLAQSILER